MTSLTLCLGEAQREIREISYGVGVTYRTIFFQPISWGQAASKMKQGDWTGTHIDAQILHVPLCGLRIQFTTDARHAAIV